MSICCDHCGKSLSGKTTVHISDNAITVCKDKLDELYADHDLMIQFEEALQHICSIDFSNLSDAYAVQAAKRIAQEMLDKCHSRPTLHASADTRPPEQRYDANWQAQESDDKKPRQ